MRPQPKHTQRRRLGLELLEDRRVLAGAVTAFKSGGNLVITGDDAGNIITVESFRAGVVQVRGFGGVNGTPTVLNGGANGLSLFFGVNDDIIIHMGRGNDLVRVTNLFIGRNLEVDMASGVDELITGRGTNSSPFGGTASGPLYVRGELLVLMGSEPDQFFQSDAHFQGVSQIDLGTGDDTWTAQRPSGSGENVEFRSKLTIVPDEGNDSLNVTGLISQDVIINDESGVLNAQLASMDVFGALKVLSTGGSDAIGISSTNVRGDMVISTQNGIDTVFFLGIARTVSIDTGDGNDLVTVTSSRIDKLLASLGNNEDTINLSNLLANELTISGDDGNDVFDLRGVRAGTGAFNGNLGFDTYREPIVPPNEIRRFTRILFERIETF